MSDPHQQLAQYLDELPAGYPATESGVELRILRKLFSAQEAEIALYLSLKPEPASAVADRAHQPVEEVARLLEEMGRKGLISVNQPEGKPPYYSVSQFVIGIWEDQVNRLDQELVKLFEEYAPIFFQKGPWIKLPQMRAIPVNEAIPITSEVMPYDSAEEIIRSKTTFAVRNCICRQERQLVGEGCGKPMETCLTFEGAARETVATGKGRLISQEEALVILDQAKRAGLVLQPANSKNPIFLCACCSCCCGVLRHIKHHTNPASLVANPFVAWHDAELCTACGACLDICPMEALTLADDDNIVYNRERCIGCGLCVSICTYKAIQLVRKTAEEEVAIPENTLNLYIQLAQMRRKYNAVNSSIVGAVK